MIYKKISGKIRIRMMNFFQLKMRYKIDNWYKKHKYNMNGVS